MFQRKRKDRLAALVRKLTGKETNNLPVFLILIAMNILVRILLLKYNAGEPPSGGSLCVMNESIEIANVQFQSGIFIACIVWFLEEYFFLLGMLAKVFWRVWSPHWVMVFFIVLNLFFSEC